VERSPAAPALRSGQLAAAASVGRFPGASGLRRPPGGFIAARRGHLGPPGGATPTTERRGMAPETPAGTRASGAGAALGDRGPVVPQHRATRAVGGSIHQPLHGGPVLVRSGVTRRSFCRSPPPGYVLCRTFPAGVAPSCRATRYSRLLEWQLTWANPDPGVGPGCCFLRRVNPPRHPCVL